MTAHLDPHREIQMLVTIYMNGMPFAMCMTEKASLSGMVVRLSPWALYPESISEVAITRETERGPERHRIPVALEEVNNNRARLLFHPMNPEARAALRDLLGEEAPTSQGSPGDPAPVSEVG